MKDVYNKVADIIYAKDKKILYETAYEMAIDILKLPEVKAIQVQAKVKPESGEKIAEIRNLFSPILNYFTVKDEKQELMKTYFDNKKKVNALDKIEMLEGKNLRINKPYNKIKTLLDELG